MLESKFHRRRSTLTSASETSLGGGGVARFDRSPSLSSGQSRRHQQQQRDREAVVLTQEILMQALLEIRPSVSEKEREKYSKL